MHCNNTRKLPPYGYLVCLSQGEQQQLETSQPHDTWMEADVMTLLPSAKMSDRIRDMVMCLGMGEMFGTTTGTSRNGAKGLAG